MDAADVPRSPFYDLLGVEITDLEPGRAQGHVAWREALTAVESRRVLHGGVTAALADSVGYWAVSSANGLASTPTVDLRLDYLAPATDDLLAEATVARNGGAVGTVDVDVESGGRTVATARGCFKTGGGAGGSAWEPAERGREGPD